MFDFAWGGTLIFGPKIFFVCIINSHVFNFSNKNKNNKKNKEEAGEFIFFALACPYF